MRLHFKVTTEYGHVNYVRLDYDNLTVLTLSRDDIDLQDGYDDLVDFVKCSGASLEYDDAIVDTMLETDFNKELDSFLNRMK